MPDKEPIVPQPDQHPPGRGTPRRGSSERSRPRAAQPESGPAGLRVPSTGGEPIGRERARRSAPPRAPGQREAKVDPPRPDLPDDEEPDLPRAVRRDLERVLGKGPRTQDVALALSIAGEAIDDGEAGIALELLAWAKSQASRVAAVREAYGVASYLAEDYQTALGELSTYRRLTGRVDQNHLIADSLRALGRELDRIVEVASELVEQDQAPLDRRFEAAIVWAGAVADAGDLGAGRSVLRRMLTRHPDSGAEHDLRLRSFAAELAERDEDPEDAAAHLRAIVVRDPDAYDAAERLAQLSTS